MAEMEIKSTYEKLDDRIEEWIDENEKSIIKKIIKILTKKHREKQKESHKKNCEFFHKIREDLKKSKSQNPEEFEECYWNTLVRVKQNGIIEDTKYMKMLPVAVLALSVMDIAFGIAASFADGSKLMFLGVVILLACVIALVIFGIYVYFSMETRERSCYEIILSILEDLRNGEKTLSEKK